MAYRGYRFRLAGTSKRVVEEATVKTLREQIRNHSVTVEVGRTNLRIHFFSLSIRYVDRKSIRTNYKFYKEIL